MLDLVARQVRSYLSKAATNKTCFFVYTLCIYPMYINLNALLAHFYGNGNLEQTNKGRCRFLSQRKPLLCRRSRTYMHPTSSFYQAIIAFVFSPRLLNDNLDVLGSARFFSAAKRHVLINRAGMRKSKKKREKRKAENFFFLKLKQPGRSSSSSLEHFTQFQLEEAIRPQLS